jgi:hypothetical protein
MIDANTPFLVTGASCVPWRPTNLRQLGKDEGFLEEIIGANPGVLGLEDRRRTFVGVTPRSISSSSTRRKGAASTPTSCS